MRHRKGTIALLALTAVALAFPALAASDETYRTFLGYDSRISIWIIAELHLMFGAFVLGVPIFAVTIEIIGWKTKDPRYDKLAYEFTQLLSGAFGFTATLGGLLAFALFGLYPKFMDYLAGVFHDVMYIYALLFFVESTTLYLYYYFWHKMAKQKGLHILLGILLNVCGTVIMMVANSWASFMMSPTGIEAETGKFIGTAWQAMNNVLWHPLNLHRLLGNVAFGGFVCGAYAAIRYLGAKTQEERAHYDWMGYIGNFCAVCGLIPLPFAGYYLGREVYSNSAVMGNNMMGGAFSWTFIIQAILIGGLFIGSNYYLWIGMHRIPGSERYTKYIKFIDIIIILCFAVWLTPHNLPLSAEEQIAVGGQYHPTLKYLGLMSGKNAVVNFIILSTFLSFLLYRRANLGPGIPFSRQGGKSRWILLGVAGGLILIMGYYASYLLHLNPTELDLSADKEKYFKLPAILLLIQIAAVVVTVILTLKDRGKIGQMMYLGITIVNITFVLGVYGYIVMAVANPFLRNVAVTQWMTMMSALTLLTTLDVFLFKGAPQVGEMTWGKMPGRSQYTLIFLCVFIVMLIGLMGFIRSGLRENWHIYGVMQDGSAGSWTPDNALMAKVVSACGLIFLSAVSFLFWLTSASAKKDHKSEGEPSLPPKATHPTAGKAARSGG
ncbi:MAG: cytochrome ubiquinol oxidase subunit I [Nitrospirae bacterium]|nr:cytochrome ubiquinol oxidase subunit I [Nitrospirota bacterium]